MQAVHQQMGPEAATEAAHEDEELATHDPTQILDLEELTSDESDDETYIPPPLRAHDAEAGGSQQPPPPPPQSSESSSIVTLTRLFEEEQRQAQLDLEENREIMREMGRSQQVLVAQQQAEATAQQQMNTLRLSILQ